MSVLVQLGGPTAPRRTPHARGSRRGLLLVHPVLEVENDALRRSSRPFVLEVGAPDVPNGVTQGEQEASGDLEALNPGRWLV